MDIKAVAAVLAVAVSLSACSMLFMRRPPRADGPLEPGDCTRSLAAPVIDGVLGVGHLGQAAGIWGETRDAFDTEKAYDRFRLGSALLGGAFAASAIHGFKWSGECRRRTTLSEQAIRDHLRVLATQHRGEFMKQGRRAVTRIRDRSST